MTVTVTMPGGVVVSRKFDDGVNVAMAIDTISPGDTAYVIQLPGGVQLLTSRAEGVTLEKVEIDP